jgi:hypothetical protein
MVSPAAKTLDKKNLDLFPNQKVVNFEKARKSSIIWLDKGKSIGTF